MDVLADEFVGRRVTHQAQARWIDERALAVRSQSDNSFGSGIQEKPDAALAFGEITLDVAQMCHIAADGGSAYGATIGVVDGRNGNGNIDHGAVFPYAHRFRLFDVSTVPYSFQKG